jgi:hypothetical protein
MENDSISHDPTDPRSPRKLGAGRAVLLGHLFVNVPVLLLIIGFSVLGNILLPHGWFVFFLVGFALAWTWWSLSVPRWRRWALNRGAPPDKLQRLAVATGLVWPKGWLPERTEVKPPDSQDAVGRKVGRKWRMRH